MIEKKITAGNIIQIVLILVSIIAAYFQLSNQYHILNKDIERLDLKIRHVEIDSKNLESRLVKRLDAIDRKLDRLIEGR